MTLFCNLVLYYTKKLRVIVLVLTYLEECIKIYLLIVINPYLVFIWNS